jgi:hypothetical protein
VCAVALVFTIFRLWDKDVKGAFLLALGVILIAFAAISVSGCTVSREYQPWMEVGFGYDFSHTVGSDPQCIVRLRQPIGFGPLEIGLGVAFLQNTDVYNGSHGNFALQIAYRFKRWPVTLTVRHWSNAGTVQPNLGRDFALVSWRF